MQKIATNQTPFRGNRHRTTLELTLWHAQAHREAAIEPLIPIVDAHHHLFGTQSDTHFYRREDLAHDLDSGHRILGTVYVEAFGSAWRTQGPEPLRSVGEVEMICQAGAEPIQLANGPCRLAAGVVSHVDLRLGDQVVEVLEAHLVAGQGKLRGVRQHATHTSGDIGRYIFNAPEQLLADSNFRRGFAHLQEHGLSFDVSLFHTQLNELALAWQATIDVCIEAFGAQRCMFESNFPVDKQSCAYAELWNAFKWATQFRGCRRVP